MNDRNARKFLAMKRVKQHVADNPLTPPNLAVTAEATALSTVITAVDTAASTQDSGAGAISGAVDSRLAGVQELRTLMRSLAKAARTLDATTHPDVAAKMRMSGTNSFGTLLTRAHVFKETLEPIAQAFTDLGAPATVVDELDDLIATVEAAGNRKFTGLDTRATGTVNIEAKVRLGMEHVRKLDAIFTQVYRKDPEKLALWQIAKRVTPYATGDESPTTPPDTGSGTGSGSETQPAGA